MIKELEDLARIVNTFLNLAVGRAKWHIPMAKQNWEECINIFLLADDEDIWENAEKISMGIAKEHSETEYEKYRIVQERLLNVFKCK